MTAYFAKYAAILHFLSKNTGALRIRGFLLRHDAFAGFFADDESVIALSARSGVLAFFLGKGLGGHEGDGDRCRAGAHEQGPEESTAVMADLCQCFFQVMLCHLSSPGLDDAYTDRFYLDWLLEKQPRRRYLPAPAGKSCKSSNFVHLTGCQFAAGAVGLGKSLILKHVEPSD